MNGIYRFIGRDGKWGLFKNNLYNLMIEEQQAGSYDLNILLTKYRTPIQVSGIGEFLPRMFKTYETKELFTEDWELTRE